MDSRNKIQMKDKNYFEEIFKLSRELKKNHDHHPIGAHWMMATEGSNLEFLTEKQLADALEVYLAQLNLDIEIQIINFQDDFLSDEEEEY